MDSVNYCRDALHLNLPLTEFFNVHKCDVVFRDGDNFCKDFAGAQVHISHITSGKVATMLLNQIMLTTTKKMVAVHR